jgi:ABC-type transport system substrate-binding protein
MSARRALLVVPTALGFVLSFLAWTVVVTAGPEQVARWGMVRQKGKDGGKKRVEEEEDDKAPKTKEKDKGSKRSEEEDDRPVKSGVSRLDDDADKRPASTAAANIDLAAAARSATHEKIKELFQTLAVPHDEVTLKRVTGVTSDGQRLGGKLRVEPLPNYIADVRTIKTGFSVNVIDMAGKPVRTESGISSYVQTVRYYEEIGVEAVRAYLVHKYDTYPATSPLHLGRYNQLVAAEQALAAVLRFHQSAREREVRKGAGWEVVETALRQQLLKTLLGQLDQLAQSKAWDPALALTRRIVETFNKPGDHKEIAGPLADVLQMAIKDPNFTQDKLKEIRSGLRFLEDRGGPSSEVLRPITDTLRTQAERLLAQAKELHREKKLPEALAKLKEAEETWPELANLRAFRIEIDRAYQVLEVHVRSQPQFVSPGWACTDTEMRAVELLFESLVALTPDDSGVMYYRPVLAERRPRVLTLGRELKLPRNLMWSDKKPLTLGDLQYTIDLISKNKYSGRSSAWSELLDHGRSSADPFSVRVKLRQGFMDPLAAMSFKILPARSGVDTNPTSRGFASRPISSGPFEYKGRVAGKDRSYTSFPANPYYPLRVNKAGLPRISEVRFYTSPDPVKDLQDGRINLALDLTPDQAAELAKNPGLFEVPMPTAKTSNRRIHFLAVNHRKPVLATPEIRIALARAISREQILDEHFRKGLGKKVHRVLNGPYPAGSWACKPDLVNRFDETSLDPFDPDLARTKLNEGMAKLKMDRISLTVKYATGDPTAEAAIKEMCAQVQKTLPRVTLKPEGLDPYTLREVVEETQNYELAYYHHDFVDNTYWLMPLLGPLGRGRDTGNYLGYTGSLVGKIRAAETKCHFPEVVELVRAIHQQFLETEMPFVPLWQLDHLYAFRKGDVDRPPIDPQLIFTRIEEWRVKRGG